MGGDDEPSPSVRPLLPCTFSEASRSHDPAGRSRLPDPILVSRLRARRSRPLFGAAFPPQAAHVFSSWEHLVQLARTLGKALLLAMPASAIPRSGGGPMPHMLDAPRHTVSVRSGLWIARQRDLHRVSCDPFRVWRNPFEAW